MDPEGEGVQPWQVFTAMFLAFWAASAYFNHFLMTLVFCIAFGVFGELMTKFMYGEKLSRNLEQQKEDLKILLEKVNDLDNTEDEYGLELETEEDHSTFYIPEPVAVTNEEKPVTVTNKEEPVNVSNEEVPVAVTNEEEPVIISNEEMPVTVTNEEEPVTVTNEVESVTVTNEEEPIAVINDEIAEDEEDEPPPLPTKDYEMGNISTFEEGNNSCINPLEMEIEDDMTNLSVENIELELTDHAEVVDTNVNIDLGKNKNENLEPEYQNMHPIGDDIEGIETELANGNSMETLDNITNTNVPPESLVIVNNGIAGETILNNNETEREVVNDIVKRSETISIEADTDHQVGLSHDARVENQEVICAESAINEITENCDIIQLESRDEEIGSMEHPCTVGEVNEDLNVENGNVEHSETIGEIIEDLKGENTNVTQLDNEREPDCDEKKIEISSEEAVEVPGDPEIDIDLTDPAVEAAATKIQSAFKGFMKKKNTTGKL